VCVYVCVCVRVCVCMCVCVRACMLVLNATRRVSLIILTLCVNNAAVLFQVFTFSNSVQYCVILRMDVCACVFCSMY
jgi:hypothetical protein